MIWRGLAILVCVSASAQLPPSQAPMPREGAPMPGRVDAAVTDAEGRPILDLKAADFTLQALGKPQKIESCKLEKDQPLRLAVLIDDLSLPSPRLDAARRAIREFINKELRGGDEMAILRAGSGSGGLDGFTSDKAALQAAVDRARFNPASEDSTAELFAAGTLNATRTVLDGLSEIPGRKALLLISERLGYKDRAAAGGSDNHLARSAHHASTVFYTFDAAPPTEPALEQGLAAAVKETGGRAFFGDVSAALARIAQEQRSYYVLTFGSDDLGFDYITRTPKVEKVALKTSRKDTVVRARDGYFGAGDEASTSELLDTDHVLFSNTDADRLLGGIRMRITPVLTLADGWHIEAIVHVDARDLTFVKGSDGLYRTRIDTASLLIDQLGKPVKDAARSFQAQLSEESWRRLRNYGLDYTVELPLPLPGSYTVYSSLRDGASGRVGTTRQCVRAGDPKDGKLLMSSIVVRGEMEKNAQGVEDAKDPFESGSVRSFQAGHKITYTYNLFNVAADSEKRSEIETRTEIWRDGVRIYTPEPRSVPFPPEANPGRRSISGSILITESMAPGGYLLRINVTDKLTKRAASQWVDFDVRQ